MARPNKAAGRDVAILYAPTDDGKGARVVRARNGAFETGEVRPIQDGQPINQGELVRLSPRADAPCVCDVEVLHEKPAEASSSDEASAAPDRSLGRPALVASEDYRVNWDRIFGPSRKRERSLN
jgi:hypothetical protein